MKVILVVVSMLLVTVTMNTVSAQEREQPITVECGDILEGEFDANFQEQNYSINLEAGTAISVTATPLGSGLSMGIFLSGPTNLVAWISGGAYASYGIDRIDLQREPVLTTDALGSRGTHTIRLVNFRVDYYEQSEDEYYSIDGSDAGGVGIYTLFVGCTLRDGTVIEPGDTIEPSLGSAQAPAPVASGFLFPELPEDGIELPLVSGQAQTIPVGNDIVMYTYDVVNADQTATLSISRISGDISLGITVMNRDTSEIIFLGGMPSSNSLSVELTFPTSGTYAIGLFRLDTAERSGTSGAVQILLE